MLTYYRGRWPDIEIPEGMPEWLYYEIDVETDNVLRCIEQFIDDRLERTGIDIDKRAGAVYPSLVHGSFMSFVDESKLDIMAGSDFNALWAAAEDKTLA